MQYKIFRFLKYFEISSGFKLGYVKDYELILGPYNNC